MLQTIDGKVMTPLSGGFLVYYNQIVGRMGSCSRRSKYISISW